MTRLYSITRKGTVYTMGDAILLYSYIYDCTTRSSADWKPLVAGLRESNPDIIHSKIAGHCLQGEIKWNDQTYKNKWMWNMVPYWLHDAALQLAAVVPTTVVQVVIYYCQYRVSYWFASIYTYDIVLYFTDKLQCTCCYTCPVLAEHEEQRSPVGPISARSVMTTFTILYCIHIYVFARVSFTRYSYDIACITQYNMHTLCLSALSSSTLCRYTCITWLLVNAHHGAHVGWRCLEPQNALILDVLEATEVLVASPHRVLATEVPAVLESLDGLAVLTWYR